MPRLIELLQKPIDALSSWLRWVALVVLMGMMLFTTGDVVGRYAFSRPIKGSFELSQYMLVAVVMFGLAYTQAKGRHISVRILMERLPFRVQAAIDSIFLLAGTAILGLIFWETLGQALDLYHEGAVTQILEMSLAPSYFMVPMGVLVWTLQFLLDWLRALVRLTRERA